MRPELPPLEAIRHVHLIAVCGTGMGSLACMLAERGFRVTGSDVDAYPPMSEQLGAAGIEVIKGYAPENVTADPPDLVVIGNAVRRDNPEAQAVLEAGIPHVSFPDAVHDLFIAGRHSVVVTGTHGKTTCTSLVAAILSHAGRDPGVLVGGVSLDLGGSFRLGQGEHFVIEGDEYDTAFWDKTPKFLHYAPRTVLFTSCEFDHADIYDSLEDVQASFVELMERVPADGLVIAATDSPSVREVVARSVARVEGYGFREDAQWRPSDVSFDASGTHFTAWRGETSFARLRMPLHGRHNVENALGAVAVCAALGLSADEIAAGLEAFQGVRRRQELRGEEDGFAVIDDFAHHPTAVRETIAAVRAGWPDRKLWAVFEPRTNTSRRRVFQDEYVEALAAADEVVLAEVFRKDAIPEAERMDPEQVVARLQAAGTPAAYRPDPEAIIEHLVAKRSGRDVALIMSNGAFGGIWDRLLARLRQG